MSSSLIQRRVWASVKGQESGLIHVSVNQALSMTNLQLHQLLLHFPEVGTQFQGVIRDGAYILRLQCRFTRVDCVVHLSLVLLQLSEHGFDLKGRALEPSLTYHPLHSTYLADLQLCLLQIRGHLLQFCRTVLVLRLERRLLFLKRLQLGLLSVQLRRLLFNSLLLLCTLITDLCHLGKGNRTTLSGLLRIVDNYLQGLNSYWIIIIAMVLKRTQKLMQGRMWYCMFVCWTTLQVNDEIIL